ncbi:MAG TPA: hypothetical protein VHX52_01420 [Steroidobacteraceae bacterium]|jgi:hypothetical protein|nr:hypothetical protein [Steroidobacteraceae bacterium]
MKARSLALTSLALSCLAALLYTGAVQAQIDLTGNWMVESTQDMRKDLNGPFPDNFVGIPVNQQGRDAGAAYSGDERQELYRECEPWSAHYIVTGPWGGRFTATRDRDGHVLAWNLSSPAYDRLPMTIWMDGQAQPPPQALHTYAGFTTGEWQGDTLLTLTTHLKDSFIERNGLPASNQETLRLFITRHGDELMAMGIISDPVYLEAPWVVAKTFTLNDRGSADEPILHCPPAEVVAGLSDGYHSATELPGDIPGMKQYMPKHYNIPLDAAMGGAQTMYPDFRKKLATEYKPPTTYCKQYCCPMGRAGSQACRTAD